MKLTQIDLNIIKNTSNKNLERSFFMDKLQKNLIESIAVDHNISPKTLSDILKTANDFTYNKTTTGQRINEYYGLIKFAVNNESK